MRYLITLCAAISILNAASCYADMSIYRFNPQSKHLATEKIKGLNSLNFLVSTGNYAWACDAQGNIAFYNGQQWQNAQKVPNISKLTSIYPAYPLAGNQPTAWALGEQNDQYIISYFNGSTWSNVQSVPKSAGQISLTASAGHAWYVLNDEDGNNATIHVSSDTTPTNWTTSNTTLSGVTMGSGDVIQALSDIGAFAYVTCIDDNYNFRLARIDGNGDVKMISNPAGKLDDFFIHENILIVSSLHKSQSFSDSYGDGFEIPFPMTGVGVNTQYGFNSAGSGMECVNLSSTGNNLSCLKRFDQTAWHDFTVPTTATYTLPITTPTGAYVFGVDRKGISLVITGMYSYDYAENFVRDTSLTNYQTNYFSPRVFSYNQVLIAGDQNIYFYDGNKWQTIALPVIKTPRTVYDMNSFGNMGSGTMQLYASDGNHIWIYPRTK